MSFTTPPSPEDLAALAEAALATIPAPLSVHLRGLAIVVEDMPDDSTLAEMEIDCGWELTGLYRGVPLHHQSVSDPPRAPDMIFLYREPILLEWIETGCDLAALVREVLIHEVAHHFGFSDEEIAALEEDGTAPSVR